MDGSGILWALVNGNVTVGLRHFLKCNELSRHIWARGSEWPLTSCLSKST